jgi:hypothetical protein
VKLRAHKAVVRPSCAATSCPLSLCCSEVSDCHFGVPEHTSVLGGEAVILREWCSEFRRIMMLLAGPRGRAVYSVGVRPLACCDRGFESQKRHGCLSVVCVVSCQVRRAEHLSRGL